MNSRIWCCLVCCVWLLAPAFVEARTLHEFEEEIARRIKSEKNLEDIVLEIDGRVGLKEGNDLELLSVLISDDSKFSAMFVSNAGEGVVSGKYHIVVSVPVLSQSLPAKSVIGEDAIKFIKVPSYKVMSSHVAKKEGLVGKVTKKRLAAGALIKNYDVDSMPIVQKGDNVIIRFMRENLVIEAPGLSIDSGSIGGAVRVKNSESNKIIHGIIADVGIVEVR